MSTTPYLTRFNLTKAGIACFAIVALTLLYVVGIISYNHHRLQKPLKHLGSGVGHGIQAMVVQYVLPPLSPHLTPLFR